MDPIRTLLEFLRDRLPQFDPEFESRIREIFSKFELVPKHDYEAHLTVLRGLEAQVQELEERLATLEKPQ